MYDLMPTTYPDIFQPTIPATLEGLGAATTIPNKPPWWPGWKTWDAAALKRPVDITNHYASLLSNANKYFGSRCKNAGGAWAGGVCSVEPGSPPPPPNTILLNGFMEDVGMNPLWAIGGGAVVGALYYSRKRKSTKHTRAISPGAVKGAVIGAAVGAIFNYVTGPCWTGVLTQFSDCRKFGGCR